MSETTGGRPMEILLVEDSLVFARIAMTALKKSNILHRVTLVIDGEEALLFLNRRGVFAQAPRPDLVLLDLGLPKKDGREVLAEMKQDDDLKEIPVVVVTASDDDHDQAQSELLGVSDYMNKPIDIQQFLRVVKNLRHAWHDDILLPTLDQ